MSLTNFVKRVRNIMRNDAGLNGDAQRIEQLAWMLFLKVYDEKEKDWELEDGYRSVMPDGCQWRAWAHDNGDGHALTGDELLAFVNNDLFVKLKSIDVTPATPVRQAIVKTAFEDANQYMKDGVLLRQLLNVIDGLDLGDYKERYTFGGIYETILRQLQSAGSSGEYYTPRTLTEFMAETISPRLGEKMADFACGTGGFLTSWLNELDRRVETAADRDELNKSVFGIEKKQLPYILCVTNLLLHGIDSPSVLHDNSLTKDVLNYTDEDRFDVVLMNPPYGGNEKNDVKSHFPSDMRSSETADLFMVLIMYRLKANGRAAVILPDGFLFGADNTKIAIKKELLRDFNLHTIIRLPGSVFAPYTSIATNILFFDNSRADGAPEGFATKETWFYRLDMPEGYKHFSMTRPIKSEHMNPVRGWWNNRMEIVIKEGDEKSRRFTVNELMASDYNFDLCKFPKEDEEILPPIELLNKYYQKRAALNHEIDMTLNEIKRMLGIETNTNK